MSKENNNLLPALREENVQMIVKDAPEAYNKNVALSQKCIVAGENLLERIKNGGMTDALDIECSEFMEKTKKALSIMNKRRSPFTQLFDKIRSEFTGMENAINPTNNNSVPFKVQQARNAYAAKKREEEEKKRQEELKRQQHEQSLTKYRQEVEDDIKRQFDQLITKDINFLTELNKNLTLENYTTTLMQVKAVDAVLSKSWASSYQCHAHKPFDITSDEAFNICREVLTRIAPDLEAQYKQEIGDYKDSILDTLPNKYAELERMAKSNAEEQAKIKADLEAKEQAELSRMEAERRKREQEEEAKRQVQKEANEMGGLFNQAMVAAPAGYQPKTSVKLKVTALNAQGILDILGMWWGKEGQFLPVDELEKMFKRQITAVEKYANDKENKELITTPNVRYDEEVKAR